MSQVSWGGVGDTLLVYRCVYYVCAHKYIWMRGLKCSIDLSNFFYFFSFLLSNLFFY